MTQIQGYSESVLDDAVSTLIKCMIQQAGSCHLERLDFLLNYLLDRPYALHPVGEGPDGLFNQNPLYRTDVFDCVTFLNSVLALVMSDNIQHFRDYWLAINYQGSKVSYLCRHHFMSVDWNIANAKSGFIRDITTCWKVAAGQRIYQWAEAVIDRGGWLRQHCSASLKLLSPLSSSKKMALLARLHQCANRYVAELNRLPFLPMTSLLDENGQLTLTFTRQLPRLAVVEFVRPNWDLMSTIGTHLNVSHVGLLRCVVQEGIQVIYLYHASQTEGRVVRRSFEKYCRERMNAANIAGVNIQAVTAFSC